MKKWNEQFDLLVKSRSPLIFIRSREEERVQELIEEATRILSYDQNRMKENLLKINFNNNILKMIEFFKQEIKNKKSIKDLKESYFFQMKKLNVKVGDGMKSLRLSLTSELNGADLFTIIEILTTQTIKHRLEDSLNIMYEKNRNN